MKKHSLFRMFAAVLAVLFSVQLVSAFESPVDWEASLSPVENGSATLTVTGVVKPEWHIYGFEMPDYDATAAVPDPTDIELSLPAGVTADGAMQKNGNSTMHLDEYMELNLPWLTGTLSFVQKLKIEPSAAGEIKGTVSYMACTDQSCTPPAKFDFNIPVGAPAAATDAEELVAVVEQEAPAQVSSKLENEWWAPVETESDDSTQSFWSILLFGFLGGLVALMTPCVWPMIPMTVSFFLKKNKSRRRSIIDAVVYSISIIVIFLLLGIVLTLVFGPGKLNEIATGALFNLIFFALLVFFAISFLDRKSVV